MKVLYQVLAALKFGEPEILMLANVLDYRLFNNKLGIGLGLFWPG